jgi:hypothetical protein
MMRFIYAELWHVKAPNAAKNNKIIRFDPLMFFARDENLSAHIPTTIFSF